ncbi:MAG TPA: glycerol-3-phosphate 1-O-acyltransferase PlsY [Candidatus Acidoferrales bacterium]|jgi:glycerol-3-phosphate acyltransferase PlsY|nr:glycerol-3-phosphate 1-O-acyltransferase PlsY [Candidatus Acidoferrales bacterium]
MTWVLIIFLSYLIGSIPWGYLFARAKGVDIRQHGSGNIGAANVHRVMGKKWGYVVFLCDFLKGLLSVKLGALIAAHFQLSPVMGGVIAGIACVLGHDYSIWLRFKGGKGIATLAGAVLALFPLGLVSFAVVWIVVFFIGRYTSLASICAAAILPVAVILLVANTEPDFPWLVGFSISMAALAIWRHRGNIARLANGTESRFGKK